ncbi:MAG: hypothetical protein ACR2MX_12290, partial [Cyclobacteriaceae bacterium]
IRAVEIKVYYPQGDKEKMNRIQMKANDPLSQSTDLILARDTDDFEYQTTWFIKGKDPVFSDRIPTGNGMVYLDKFPNKDQ